MSSCIHNKPKIKCQPCSNAEADKWMKREGKKLLNDRQTRREGSLMYAISKMKLKFQWMT